MNDPFDFTAFVHRASNPDAETRKKMLRDAVNDELDDAMGEVAPRIWCIMQEQMLREPKNNIHLNAVMNAAIFAILGWVVACTPDGESDGADNDDVLREKILGNVNNALENARGQGAHMARIAQGAGKLKLMDDAMAGLSTVLMSNSMIIKGIHSRLSPPEE